MKGKTVSVIYLFSFGSQGPLKYSPIYDTGAESVNYISHLVKWLPAQFYQQKSIEGDHKVKEEEKKKKTSFCSSISL